MAAWGNAGPLAAVATAGGATGGTGGWAGKENAAADAAAIATKALALAALVPRAEAAAAAAPDVGRDGERERGRGQHGKEDGGVEVGCALSSPSFMSHTLFSSPLTHPTAGDAVLAEVEAFRAAAGGVDAGALRRLRELVAPTA